MSMGIQEIIAIILISAGLFFLTVAAVGLLRLPDFYTRMHASGNGETLGLMLSLLGLIVYEGATLNSVKMLMIFLLVFIGNPIGTHILSKSALKTGHPMWTNEKKGGEK